MTRKQRHESYEDCPVEAVFDVIGGKWKASILQSLADGPQRNGALTRQFPKISQRHLTNQLRALEADGLVARTVHPEVPPRVDYELTDLGRSLMPPLTALADWGRANLLAPEPAADGNRHD